MDSLNSLLFENPWPLGAMLVLAGLVLLFHANQRRDRRIAGVAALAVALAVAVFAVERAVTTPREQVHAALARLAQLAAADHVDRSLLAELLDANISLEGPDGTPWLDGDEVLDEMVVAVRKWKVLDNRVEWVEVRMVPPGLAYANVRFRTMLGGEMKRPLRTEWELTWHQEPAKTWHLARAKWLRIQDREPQNRNWR